MHQTWYRTLTDKKNIQSFLLFYFPQICFPLVCLWVALILVLFSTNKKPSINSTIFGHNLCWVSLFKRIIIYLQTQPFFTTWLFSFISIKIIRSDKTVLYQQWTDLVWFPISELALFHLCYKEWFGLGNKSSGGGMGDAFQRTFNSLTRNCPWLFPWTLCNFERVSIMLIVILDIFELVFSIYHHHQKHHRNYNHHESWHGHNHHWWIDQSQWPYVFCVTYKQLLSNY